MKRDYVEFQERNTALAYLITLRCYGTWLRGDERGSVDRRYYNRFGTSKIAPDGEKRVRRMSREFDYRRLMDDIDARCLR